MYDSNSKGISYTAGFFMLIAFAVAASIMAAFICIPIWTGMTGLSFKDLEKGMSDPANSNAIKVIQSVTVIIGFLLPAIFTAYLLNRKPMDLLGFSRKINWKQIGIVCAIMISAMFVSAFLAYVNGILPVSDSLKLRFDKMENDYNKQVEAIIGLNSFGEYILAIIIMAFLPALCEETLFRGGLQNFLTRSTKMPWLSIIIVSILFSVLHFSFYGFLSRMFLGVILGLLYQYSGRLWLNIIAHFFNNALAVTMIYVLKTQGKSLKEAVGDNSDSGWWGIIFLPAVIGLFIVFRKIAGKPKEPKKTNFDFERNEELRNTPFY
ncbi:MAG TPA: type II CAAX endopeptidase family protein [Chitinophagaceae bacterium]|nr:type II CAAX endopeptidase family protein [Chitinophagaceae bacterium]